jgi:hypothetical protein
LQSRSERACDDDRLLRVVGHTERLLRAHLTSGAFDAAFGAGWPAELLEGCDFDPILRRCARRVGVTAGGRVIEPPYGIC